MNINEPLVCPKCSGTCFSLKREASYLYVYKLGTPLTEDKSQNEEALPFLFNNRENLSNKEYLECESCKAQFPCEIDEGMTKVHLTILRKAIRADHVTNPGFLG